MAQRAYALQRVVLLVTPSEKLVLQMDLKRTKWESQTQLVAVELNDELMAV